MYLNPKYFHFVIQYPTKSIFLEFSVVENT